MWELDYKEGWVLKNWCFWIWCWRRLLRVPWTARRSNQSIVKEISPECSLEGLMLKLKLSYFGHLMRRTHSLEMTLILGKIEGRRRTEDKMVGLISFRMSFLIQWTWVWACSGRCWRTGKPGMLQFMELQSWKWLSDWTTTVTIINMFTAREKEK